MEDYSDQEVLQTLTKFCFPFYVDSLTVSQVGQNFTFVLTDIDSKQRFGFCHLSSGAKSCFCILSLCTASSLHVEWRNQEGPWATARCQRPDSLGRCGQGATSHAQQSGAGKLVKVAVAGKNHRRGGKTHFPCELQINTQVCKSGCSVTSPSVLGKGKACSSGSAQENSE
jgi:hypothetical protein